MGTGKRKLTHDTGNKWNTEYGNGLNTEITSAWDNARMTAEEYFDYVSQMSQSMDSFDFVGEGRSPVVLDGDTQTKYSGTQVNNDVVAKSQSYQVNEKVSHMKENSSKWHSADDQGRADLQAENVNYAKQIDRILGYADGKGLSLGEDGVWYLPDGRKLYTVYPGVYHSGGIVGGGGVEDNEQLALLKKKEWVLNEEMVQNLKAQIARIQEITGAFQDTSGYPGVAALTGLGDVGDRSALNNISNNRENNISFGDVYIYGGNDETVQRHQEINRQMVNEVLEKLNIKR